MDRKLSIIQDFDTFINARHLNEGLMDGMQNRCNQIFIDSGPITFEDGTSVNPKEIVNAVDKALQYLFSEFTRTMKFGSRLNVIYLRDSGQIKTMAVDENMNLYMNAGFIYHTLKMDRELIAAVIMHEVFHVLYNHIQRGKNWLAANGKPSTPQTHHDNNLAADIEVNQSLVRLGIIEKEKLVNEIHGLYLDQKYEQKTVVPMENILDSDEYMNRLREMCPPPVDPDDEKSNEQIIKTTDEWNKGYKDAWNKFAGLIKKYGYEKVWEKLQEKGIINAKGELNMDKDIDDIMSMEYLQVKSFEDYIRESLEQKKSDDGQTYDDGFITSVKKIIKKMSNAIENTNFSDSPQGPDGFSNPQKKYDTGMKEDELEELDIPSPQQNKDSGGEGDNLPENMKNKNASQNQENHTDKNQEKEKEQKKSGKDKSKNGSKTAGQDGEGKGDDEITDDDLNTLADDLKDKMNKGGNSSSKKKSGNEDTGAIGGTGSYIEDKNMIDKVLKESGYDQDVIDAINEIRERNKERNNPKAIEKAKNEMRNSLSNSSVIKRYLDAIDIASEKYKNVWKEIMEDFLATRTRRAGTKVNDTTIDWRRKSRIALGTLGPQYQKVDQDPQDVNVYVDVSGSVDTELLEIICKSLVAFSQKYKYSGINICPWATVSNGIHRVDDFNRRSESDITDEILKIVSKGINQCGGGTSSSAVLSAMVDIVVNTLADSKKKKKDDVHVVITDGEFDYQGIENTLRNAVAQETGKDNVADRTPEHTFWMIYDAPESLRERWKKEIKTGSLIFIDSETVKNNK